MFGVHQPHPDHPTYPMWSAVRWPTYEISLSKTTGFFVVETTYYNCMWFKTEKEAVGQQKKFNAIKEVRTYEYCYETCKRLNPVVTKPLWK